MHHNPSTHIPTTIVPTLPPFLFPHRNPPFLHNPCTHNHLGKEIREKFSGAVEAFSQRNPTSYSPHGDHTKHRTSEDVAVQRDLTLHCTCLHWLVLFTLHMRANHLLVMPSLGSSNVTARELKSYPCCLTVLDSEMLPLLQMLGTEYLILLLKLQKVSR